MFTDHHQYRVYLQGDARELCLIEAEAPIDAERLRRFITKTRRIFRLQDNETEIRIIELRRVTERRNITSQILDEEQTAPRSDANHRASIELHRGQISAIDQHGVVRTIFDSQDDEHAL